jgi:CHAT domain-containing protein/pimeloyl-ACP methyl ester carboxylesterase
MAESKSRRKKNVSARGKVAEKNPAQPEPAHAAVPEDHAAARSAFQLRDETVEAALTSREHAGTLEDYFGEAQYRELQKLAREASARSVRGGPRVLIVPGIMGSKLGWERKFVDDVIWIDPIDIAAGKLQDLRLNGADPKLKALGVILFAYLKLKLLLKIAGYDADFHPFDWRKSLTELGKELADRVDRDPAQTVHVVAHSMGGLVTRAALSPKASKIGRVIMLGTPNFGSFAPVQVLRAVYPILKKIAFIDGKHSAKDLVQDVFRTFPGLYEMLPWPEKFALTDLYSSAGWPTDRPTPLDSLLSAARAVQQSLPPADDRFYLIAGVNQETVVSLRKEGNEFVYDVSYEGDGTVPLAMAELPGAKTFFVEETHGGLPNNRTVAKAVEDLLAAGTTSVLPNAWAPSRAGYTRSLKEADLPSVYYEGSPGRSLSLREQRLLLQEFVSPLSREDAGAAATPASAPSALIPKGFEHEFDRIVIGRRHQHQLEIRLAHGSIVDVDSQAYVLGMFRDVSPSGAAQVIDALLEGAIQEFVTRRMFTGNVGEVSIIPTGRHAVRADLVAFAGLGAFDQFNPDVLELVAENLIRTFLKTKIDDFAIVLFGGASGQDTVTSLQNLLRGFLRGLRDADVGYRFHGVTVCETDQERYDAIKRELYRLSSTALFDQVEVIIDEIRLPPPVVPRIYGAPEEERREQVYLIARCDQSKKNVLNFESSVLTAGAKATVVKGQREVTAKELQQQLEKIRSSAFTFDKLEEFGRRLSELILPKDITTILSGFSQSHLVVVHDAMASRIPWETVYFDTHFPAAAGGLSRRYLADNLSVAKWLSQRQQGAILDVLLVINPTQDLPGAEEEGDRVLKLFGGHTSSVKLTVLRGAQAQKSTLRSHFSSGEFDIVHYAGHAYFDQDVPSNSGILCHGSQVLSGAELAGIGNLPGLMFFNACEAGRIRKPQEDDEKLSMDKRIRRNVGLAEAFLRGGIANYLGTYWPVGDEAAKLFAEKFYSALLDGHSVGDGLLDGRLAVQSIKSVDWADYVHYGNPDFVIKV